MVATNSVKVRTGNVSAGTSVFGMVVLEKELQKAENNDDMAAYKRLLTYQKKLKKEDFKL